MQETMSGPASGEPGTLHCAKTTRRTETQCETQCDPEYETQYETRRETRPEAMLLACQEAQRALEWHSRRAGLEVPDTTRSSEETQKNSVLPEADLLRAVVVKIQQHDEAAKNQLYQIFNRGIRFQLIRHLGTTDIEDKVHDTFLIVLQAILRDDLRNPERLLGYIRTVVRRQIANYIDRAMMRRREHSTGIEGTSALIHRNPEENYIRNEQQQLMRQTLSELNPRDREILVRFYIDEVPQEDICEEMGLSQTQFRLLKSRAKARFSALGKRTLRPKVLARYQAAAG